jgi:hypothetical protein
MAVLKRIGPASAFKIGLVSYAFLGLIAGVFCSLIALTGASFAPHAHMPFARAVGLTAVIVCPIVYVHSFTTSPPAGLVESKSRSTERCVFGTTTRID